jgi:ABC-type polysaccharide/polyol phosphate export permease
VFFPVEQLPEWIRPASEYLPVTWSLRIVRGTLLRGLTFADLRTELLVLAALTAVLLPFGLVASRYAIRRAKREGTLIQY